MTRLVLLSLLLLSLLVSPARAQTERPWAQGVSEADQRAAFVSFAEGNALFTESQYAAALARYREALRLWDHPAIRYNAAVSLINLDQPLPAYEHLEAALAHGAAPLGAENHRQAVLYERLLSAQLAELEVVCAEPGAKVTLDGDTLFEGPGRATRRVLPGAHQVTARKRGYLTETRAVQAPAGKLSREVVELELLGAPALRSVRRWPAWVPWTVLGGGAALGLAGAGFYLEAQSNYEAFDGEVARLCPAGCTEAELPGTAFDARRRARTQNGVAVGLFAVGGAAVATGLGLVILNQPRLEPVPPAGAAASSAARRSTRLSLRPRLSRRSAMLSALVEY
jgi:tetratricopeptide (TPR) repeat protein